MAEAALKREEVFSFTTGLSGWRCRLHVDAPGQETEIKSLFGTVMPSVGDEIDSEIFLTRQGQAWEIRWRHRGRPGDLSLLLQSPEGKRFKRISDSSEQTSEQVYADTVLGDMEALTVKHGTLVVQQSEQWAFYLEFVLTWLMMREGNIVTLHAAVCAVEETAIVLIGASGSGKSTLSAALSAQGAEFYGDESVFYNCKQKRLVVRPKQVGLRPGGLMLLSESLAGEWSEAKPNDPKYTVALPLPTRPCPQEKALFCFLEGFAATPLLAQASTADSIRRLLRVIGHGDPSLDARLDTAAEIATQFPGWRLTLGPPSETAKTLIGQVNRSCESA